MPVNMSSLLRPRRVLSLLGLVACFSGGIIFAIWYGMNSDRDYIHPVLTQLIPAGHCTCQTSTTFQCSTCLDDAHTGIHQSPEPNWKFEYPRDALNEALDRDQCQAAFPGLFEDTARGGKYWRARSGGLATEDLDSVKIEQGMARAFISKGQLHVVAARSKGEDHRRKIVGVLSSIHRALVADRSRADVRDIEFIFSVEDKVEDVTNPDNPVWVFARTPGEEGVWLMPDFSFWAWDNPNNYIGPYDQVVDRIHRLDIPWEEKRPQLVWRGKPSFAPKLRRALIEAARDKPWGDVKQVDWSTGANVLKMEDHCHYMFIAHVEGKQFALSDCSCGSSLANTFPYRAFILSFHEVPTSLQLGDCRTHTPIHPTPPLPLGRKWTQPKLHRSRARLQRLGRQDRAARQGYRGGTPHRPQQRHDLPRAIPDSRRGSMLLAITDCWLRQRLE